MFVIMITKQDYSFIFKQEARVTDLHFEEYCACCKNHEFYRMLSGKGGS